MVGTSPLLQPRISVFKSIKDRKTGQKRMPQNVLKIKLFSGFSRVYRLRSFKSVGFDRFRVIFTVFRTLFFIDRMRPASIFPVSVRMIHLHSAKFMITLSQLGKCIVKA